jgi:phage terminase large subunit-like protein
VRSLGPEAIDWVNGSGILGNGGRLLPWQEYVFRRALELTPGRDPRLRWRTVVVTVARQQGKSWGVRAAAWWRMHQAVRFREDQTVLHIANLATTAREVWKPAARHAVDVYGKKASKYGKGQEEIDVPEIGGRWVIQAASDNSGVGYSIPMGIVDEAWNVGRPIVDESLRPAMSERNEPQLWLISTAGDSSSDLLQTYRDLALQDKDGTGDVLLIEWSAPPDAPYDDPATWRWASPHWSDRRRDFLHSQLASVGEETFRRQYLNQWTLATGGWIQAGTWARGYADVEPEGAPDVVAVEVSPDGARFGLCAAWRHGDAVIVRGYATMSSSALWHRVEDYQARALLLPPQLHVHYRGRQKATMVGVTEMGRHLPGVGRAIGDGIVLHRSDDHVLNDDVGRAVASTTEAGLRLSNRKSSGPIEVTRAMVWAVGETLRPANPRPLIRVG